MRLQCRKRAVLLMSGGIESSVLLHQLLATKFEVFPVFIDYHQRGREMEKRASSAVVQDALQPTLEVLDLSAIGSKFQQINKLHIPLPHRNLPLLSLALSWASAHDCSSIAIGITKDDVDKGNTGHVINTKTSKLEFLHTFGELVHTLEPGIEVITPQIDMTKLEVLSEGLKYTGSSSVHHGAGTSPSPGACSLDLTKTYSCMRGGEIHCGSCMQCIARKGAFVAAGIAEPDGFYRR